MKSKLGVLIVLTLVVGCGPTKAKVTRHSGLGQIGDFINGKSVSNQASGRSLSSVVTSVIYGDSTDKTGAPATSVQWMADANAPIAAFAINKCQKADLSQCSLFVGAQNQAGVWTQYISDGSGGFTAAGTPEVSMVQSALVFSVDVSGQTVVRETETLTIRAYSSAGDAL